MRNSTLALFSILFFSSVSNAKEITLPAAGAETYTLVSQEQELPQAIVVYQHQGRNLIPLQALAAAIGLDIRVDTAQLTANGWIGGENSNFLLDIDAEEARRGFERFDLDPNQPWGRDSADLYIDEAVIEQILPLRLNLNRQAQRLLVESELVLPAVEQLKAQQANNARLGLQQNFHSGGFDPIHPHDYQRFNKPTVLAFGNAAIVGQDIFTQDFNFGFIASGDALGQSYELNYNKLRQERSEYRLRFSRDLNDYSQDLPFNLGQYQLGDITYHGDNLLQGANEGFGFQIGDAKQHQFGVATIEGNAPPEWQVHLYRNGILLDITKVPDSGRYFFNDQPMLAGANVFEMHLYGLNGEHQVRRKTINNSHQTGAGKLSYNFMYLDNTKFLFNDRDRQELDGLGSLQQIGLRLNYGITDWWDIGLLFQNQTFAEPKETTPERPDPDNPGEMLPEKTIYPESSATYYGLNSSLDVWGSQIELEAVRGDGNMAYFAGFNRPIGDSYFVRSSYRRNGEMRTDLVESRNDNLSSFADLWLEGQTWRWGGWQYAIGTEYGQPQDSELDSTLMLANRLSTQIGNVSFTHTYLYDTAYEGEAQGRHQGKLLLATTGYDWSTSTYLHYQAGEGFRDYETRIRWAPMGNIINHTRLFYEKPFGVTNNRWGMAHEIAYRYNWLTLGFETGFDDNGDWQLNGTATIAYNYSDNRDIDFDKSIRPQLADITVRVYRDANNNGRFDRTDQPLRGITIDTSPSWPRQVSDDTGIVLLKQVPANGTYRFGISGNSLPEGMVLRNGPMELMPLAGESNQVDLALVTVSSIRGRLSDQHGQPVVGLELNITDLSQRRITAVTSNKKGEFYFPSLRPGQYYLIANPEQMRDRGLSSAIPLYPLNISANGDDRDDWQIQLLNSAVPKPAEPQQAKVQPQLQPQRPTQPFTSQDPLMSMDAQDYVLQVAASQQPFALTTLRNQYPQMSLTQTQVMRAGKPTYLLLAGQYPSETSALRGRRDMPLELTNGQPIPRRVADLRREQLSPSSAATEAAPIPAPAVATVSANSPVAPIATDWLTQQPAKNLTWQVVATRARSSAEAFVQQHQLPQPWQIHQHNGWYQVLWGSFANEVEARNAMDALAEPLEQPWLRPFSALH